MHNIGEIVIRVTGKEGDQELQPSSFDIKYLAELLGNVEDLLYPGAKKGRPTIAYDVRGGSVNHIFKTSMQAVIGLSAILTQVADQQNVDFLEYKTARAIENIQKLAVEKNYRFELKTSLNEEYELVVTPKTRYYLSQNYWADAEFYFYGVLKDAGGKTKANIHLDTADHGYLSIETGEEFLKNQEANLLYKKYGVRAVGKQNVSTGEIDTKSLHLIELIDYEPAFDQDYLNRLIQKAKSRLKGIDADEWLNDLRGGYEA